MKTVKSADLEYLVPDEKKQVPITLADKVTEIVSYYDIMNFQDRDLEDNEYDIEVNIILYRLGKVNDLKELQWMIHDVFVSCFSDDPQRQSGDRCFRYMAEEIWEVWQEEIERLGLAKSQRIFGRK